MGNWTSKTIKISNPLDFSTTHKIMMAQFFMSIIKESGHNVAVANELVSSHRGTFIAEIRNKRVGFLCGVMTGDVVGVENQIDVMFAPYCHSHIYQKYHNIYPFAPPTFGTATNPWSNYFWARDSLRYNAWGKNVIAYFGWPAYAKHGDQEPNSQFRLDAQKSLASSEFKVLNKEFVNQREFYKFKEGCLLAVGCPGIHPDLVDKTVMELMAIGCCVVHPKINYPFPAGGLQAGVHYLACEDDYSDLPKVLNTPKKVLVEIAENSKNYFKTNLLPEPLFDYINNVLDNNVPCEHITISPSELKSCEKQMRLFRHIERYRLARWFAKGKVLDFGCGCGYGSSLMADNPDVSSVLGLDISEDALQYANTHYKTLKTSFSREVSGDFDTIVAVEVLEHLDKLNSFVELVKTVNPRMIIVTFPSYKSTHFNHFHKQDLKEKMVAAHLPAYEVVVCEYVQLTETCFMVLERIKHDQIHYML